MVKNINSEMEVFSFQNFEQKNQSTLEEQIHKKTNRLLGADILKEFNFELDFVAADGVMVYLGSNVKMNILNVPITMNRSSIYKYHIYDDSLAEFMNFGLKISHLVVIPELQALFVVFENRSCKVIHQLTRQILYNSKLESNIEKVVAVATEPKIYYSIGNNIYVLNGRNSNFRHKKVATCQSKIKSFDLIYSADAFLILSEMGELIVYNRKLRKQQKFSDKLLPPIADFRLEEETNQIALKTRTSIQIWSLLQNQRIPKLQEESFNVKEIELDSDYEVNDFDADYENQSTVKKNGGYNKQDRRKQYSNIRGNQVRSNNIQDSVLSNNEDELRQNARNNQLANFLNYPFNSSHQVLCSYNVPEDFKQLWLYIGLKNALFAYYPDKTIRLSIAFMSEIKPLFELQTSCTHLKYLKSLKKVLFVENLTTLRIHSLNRVFNAFDYNPYYPDPFTIILLDESEQSILSFDNKNVRRYDITSNILLQTHELSPIKQITSCAYNKKENVYFAGSSCGNICVFQIIPFSLVTIINAFQEEGKVNVAVYKSCLISVSENCKEIKLWDLENYKLQTTIQRSKEGGKGFNHLSVSEDLEIAVAIADSSTLVSFNVHKILSESPQGKSKIDDILIIEDEKKLISMTCFEVSIWDLPNMTMLKRVNHLTNFSKGEYIGKSIVVFVDKYSRGLSFVEIKGLNALYTYSNDVEVEGMSSVISNKFKNCKFAMKTGNLVCVRQNGIMEEVKINSNSFLNRLDLYSITHNQCYSYQESTNKMVYNQKKKPLYVLNPKTLSYSYSRTLDQSAQESSILYVRLFKKLNLMFVVLSNAIKLIDQNKNEEFIHTVDTEEFIEFVHILDDSDELITISASNLISVRTIPDMTVVKETQIDQSDKVLAMRADDNSKLLFFGCASGKLYKWNITKSGEPVQFGSHYSSITCLATCQSKAILMSACEGRIVKVWKLSDLQLIKSFKVKLLVQKVYFNHRMNLFLIYSSSHDSDCCISVYNLITFEEVTSFHIEDLQAVNRPIKMIPSIDSDQLHLFKEMQNSYYRTSGTMSDFLEIWEPTFIEKIYLQNIFSSTVSTSELLNSFRQLKFIYDSSHVLKEFFNIYLAAALSKHKEIFKILYFQDVVQYELSNNQISPLLCLAKSNSIEVMKNVLHMFRKNKIFIPLEQNIVEYLLSTSEGFGKQFLVCNIRTMSRFDDINIKIPKLGSYKKYTILSKQMHFIYKDDLNQIALPNSTETRNVEIYNMNAKWNFAHYTQMSTLFLEEYAKAADDEFVMSPYGHIISYKWTYFGRFLITHALVYWLHLIFFLLYLINYETTAYFIVDWIMLSFLLSYEILNFCSTGKDYFLDMINYLDILSICSCFVFLILTNYQSTYLDNIVYQIFLILTMIMISCRGFFFFKYFAGFSHIAQMTIGMIWHSLSIVVIIIYFGLCLSAIMTKTKIGDSFASSLEINYNLIFGNLPDFQDKNVLHLILIIIGSVLLPIFLINFLIAKMSGTYSTLDNRQKVLSFKELALSLLEVEKMGQFIIKAIGKLIEENENFVYLSVDQERIDEMNDIGTSDKLIKEVSENQKQNRKYVYEPMTKQISEVTKMLKASDDANRDEIREIKSLLKGLSAQMKESEGKISRLEELISSKLSSPSNPNSIK